MNVINTMKDIIETMNKEEDTETTQNLLDLKKELAEQIFEKLEAENSDFMLSIGRDVVIDYLVEEWWTDKIHDAVVEQGLDAFLPSLALELKERREKLKEASTEAELQRLKAEITNRNESLNANNLSSSEQSTTEAAKENATSEGELVAETKWTQSVASLTSSKSFWTTIEHNAQIAKINLLSSGLIGFNADKIQSFPFERSKSWTTLCAKTAKKNAEKFGIELPSGNARDASQELPTAENYKTTLPVDKKTDRPQRSREPLTIEDFDAMEGVNVADIFPDSKSQYGHRAVAFRDDSWERMVLDPYIKVNGVRDTKPKKLEDYMQARKVFKSHFYQVKSYDTLA